MTESNKSTDNNEEANNSNNKLEEIKKYFSQNKEQFCEQIHTLLESSFFIKDSHLQTRVYKSKSEAESAIYSQLNIKYPLLTAVFSKKFEDFELNLTKCFVCDMTTHCEFIQRKSLDISDNLNSETDKKSFLENRQFSDIKTSSHSSALSKNINDRSQFSIALFVNSKKMILNLDNDLLTNAENYSSVYDILLNNKEEKLADSDVFDDFKLINKVPIFEQRRFINQIDEKYTLSHKCCAKEEILKKKLKILVNCLLNNESNINDNSLTLISNDNSNTRIQKANEQQNEPKKIRKKYDENALSSSVFGMEEIDESDDEEKFLSDQESQDEQEDQVHKSVLKKRNSNISDADSRNIPTAKLNFSKVNSIERKDQYSFSLPRDIPVMTTRQSLAKTYHKDYDNNNENNFNPIKEQLKHHTLITNSYKQPNTYLNHFNTSNDIEGDDDLFEDDMNNAGQENQGNFDFDDDASNMGQAISTLASSIVIKDGRELFGGVPSRRVPINSISKSCYE